jgi:hypothetical protein
MDPMLRALANKVVLAAQLLPDIFNKNDVLKQTRVLLQVQIQNLHDAAGEILSGPPPRFRTPALIGSGPEWRMGNAGTAFEVFARVQGRGGEVGD